MTPPLLPGIMYDYVGKVLNYCSSDTEEKYQHNKKFFPDRLIEHGWYDISIDYRFNSQGFRTREFDVNEEKFLAIGCSFTFGEGLHEYQIYHAMISDALRIPCYNLGIPGIGNMTMFRLAEYWIPELKPKFVILQSTFSERFEIINSNKNIKTFLPTFADNHTDDIKGFLREWWSCDENSHYETMRNELAIRQICTQQNIPCYVIGIDEFRPQIDLARDLSHPGYKTHQRVARQVLEMIK